MPSISIIKKIGRNWWEKVMNDYKTETRKAYQMYDEEFDQKFSRHFNLFVQKEADLFLSKVCGKKILDVGSGPGNCAVYFQNRGFDVLCIDLSEKMVERCKKRGLKAQVMDLEKLGLLPQSYDAVWAYASLLHLPKENIDNVLKKIAEILKPQGLF